MAGIVFMRSRAKQRGFTLIETSIVLVIVGLLLAAILQGRQLIESARYKSLKSDIGDYRNAFDAFRERYNALPGDFAQANSRLGLTGANGDGNGVIDDGPACAAAADESCRAWQHLRAARLISGDDSVEGTAASPEHAFRGRVSGFFSGTSGNGEFGNKLLILDVPAEFAVQLDQELDDSDPDTGWISCEDSDSDCTPGWPAVGSGATVDVVYAF